MHLVPAEASLQGQVLRDEGPTAFFDLHVTCLARCPHLDQTTLGPSSPPLHPMCILLLFTFPVPLSTSKGGSGGSGGGSGGGGGGMWRSGI